MNALPVPALTAREFARFWPYIEKTPTCWIWHGIRIPSAISSHTRHEYGVFRLKRDGRWRNVKAYRITKSIASEDHPELEIDHCCKNKLCVNPEHLEWVTHEENMRRVRKPDSQRSKRRAAAIGASGPSDLRRRNA